MLKYAILVTVLFLCFFTSILDAQQLKRPDHKVPVYPDRMPTVTGDTTIDPHMPIYHAPQDFTPVDKQPVPTYRVNPVYPDSARRAGLEGTVWLKALVDTDGMVKKAVVVRSDNRIFDDAARQALLQWRFIPAILHGKFVRVWAMVPFHFKLGPKK